MFVVLVDEREERIHISSSHEYGPRWEQGREDVTLPSPSSVLILHKRGRLRVFGTQVHPSAIRGHATDMRCTSCGWAVLSVTHEHRCMWHPRIHAL